MKIALPGVATIASSCDDKRAHAEVIPSFWCCPCIVWYGCSSIFSTTQFHPWYLNYFKQRGNIWLALFRSCIDYRGAYCRAVPRWWHWVGLAWLQQLLHFQCLIPWTPAWQNEWPNRMFHNNVVETRWANLPKCSLPEESAETVFPQIYAGNISFSVWYCRVAKWWFCWRHI